MTIFKCKMCGGTIEFNPGDSVGICDSCGTRQTLPRLDDDRRANLYDRANHFRRNNEFDKAVGLYEQILNEDPTDAEAYWSLVLCRYGIEYVEDPATHKRVPTVNRTQFTSIFDDEDYKSALQHADRYQRTIYEEEAVAINEIQKGILAISQKEKPFDVFICYKETDKAGRRSQDSVLANDLYYQLTNEGFKVFFSRITLEDKLGTAYEPYIFAALNSAKVMVVLGTKPEHFNAVWVKNEWSRYLSLVKQSGGKKVLIPTYRDMDPYDLPEEFSHLQAQDMSKLGFMQDLIRGIKKIARVDEPKVTVKETVVTGSTVGVAPLLKRAFMFLEDGEWKRADDFCEQVLNLDPENAQAYLGKLMAELHVHKPEELPNCRQPFDGSNNYQKAIRFGDEKLSSKLKGYITYINGRNENNRLLDTYNVAVKALYEAKDESAYKSAAAAFNTIQGFKDADVLAEQCLERAEVCRKDATYKIARSRMMDKTISSCESAIESFNTIIGWKDADEQIRVCRQKIEEIKAYEETRRLEQEKWAEQARIRAEKAAKRRKKKITIVALTIVTCIAFAVVITAVIIPKKTLNKAMNLLNSGENEAAYALLEKIGNSNAIASSKYDCAMELINLEDYKAAYRLLNGLKYKDSVIQLEAIKPILLSRAEVGDYVLFGSYEQDNKASNGKENIEWLVLDKEEDSMLVISRYALDFQEYDTVPKKGGFISGDYVYSWMNHTFKSNAFNPEEEKLIKGGINLLHVGNINKYFASDRERMCKGTAYCYAQGAKKGVAGNCWWWLHSYGKEDNFAAYVRDDGTVAEYRYYVHVYGDAVRPAMEIMLEP